MIKFEKAKNKALQINKNIQVAYDYKSAYVFNEVENDNEGGMFPIAVIKETGETMPITLFLNKYRTNISKPMMVWEKGDQEDNTNEESKTMDNN